MVGFFNYSVILTYLGAACGVLGVGFCVRGEPFSAVLCLMVCGFCDLFDGTVARTCKRGEQEKQFGIQIDSLSDLLCFGALPAAIGFSLGLTRWFETLVLALYVLCALIRLAYFNVTEEQLTLIRGEKRVFYEGLPVTGSALLLPLLYAFRPLLPEVFPHVYLLALLLVGAAYVLKIRVRKIGLRGMIAAACLGALVLAALLLGRSAQ